MLGLKTTKYMLNEKTKGSKILQKEEVDSKVCCEVM